MADHAGEPSGTTEPDEVDLSEPVTVLAELSQAPTTGFLGGIRRRIQRRHFASDTADFSLSGLSFVALEFLKMFFELFHRTDREEGDV